MSPIARLLTVAFFALCALAALHADAPATGLSGILPGYARAQLTVSIMNNFGGL